MELSKEDKLAMCIGCVDNFYNGNNPLGVKECWLLSSAEKVERKKVGFWQNPPWDQEPIEVLSCRKEKGFVFVEPNRTN